MNTRRRPVSRTMLLLSCALVGALVTGCQNGLLDAPEGGQPTGEEPTGGESGPSIVYFGGYEPAIYTIGDASGKNDTVVPGFDEDVRAALVDGSTFYYVSDDTGPARVLEMKPAGASDDVEVAGFDYLDPDSSIYLVESTWYYSVHDEGAPQDLGLYEMVDGADDDTLVSGYDHTLGTNTNGPYFYHDGSQWYYTVNPTSFPYDAIGIFSLGPSTDDDVQVSGVDDTGSVAITGQPMGSDIEYSDGGQWFRLDASGADPLIEGFDVQPDCIFSDGTERYYAHQGQVYQVDATPGDDEVYSDVDPNYDGLRFVFSDGSDVYAHVNTSSGWRLVRITSGADEELPGLDDDSCDFAAWDGSVLYYAAHNGTGRAVYRREGSEPTGDGTDDVEMPGLDVQLRYPSYSFAVVNGVILYPDDGVVMQVVGDEENFTGSNDTVHATLDTSERPVSIAVYDGDLYYSLNDGSIYRHVESGADEEVVSGSIVDSTPESFAIFN